MEIRRRTMRTSETDALNGDQRNCEWATKPAIGRFRGLLMIWDSSIIKKVSGIQGNGFMGAAFVYQGNTCVVVNVYSSFSKEVKMAQWGQIYAERARSTEDLRYIAGDFNSVQAEEERRSRMGVVSQTDMEIFNNFIGAMEVEEPQLYGRKYTWMNTEGTAMLVLEEWRRKMGESAQWIRMTGAQSHSDRFLNCLLEEASLTQVIPEAIQRNLVAKFTREEIDQTLLLECGNNKSPGPDDGFWYLMFMREASEPTHNGQLPCVMTAILFFFMNGSVIENLEGDPTYYLEQKEW
ncbi:hypothetical protein VNO77_44448 [Canavalia gladiata]|uniref:Endonuclease/exonuclease/phosphatase domain-containing protein n=1 Tax=Canavalia gladiata TaxID=3824 RepID=A0AAN9PQC8_CANGL